MLIEELMYNPYVWLVISLSTILAFGFAIYTWNAGKKKKEIAFYQTSTRLVEEGKSIVSELKLIYKDRVVDNLTITKLAIWNSGNEVINGEDIVAVKPLEIITHDEAIDILDAKIIRQSDSTNMFILVKTELKKAKLKFDYLNPEDGIVVQIIHTGKHSDIALDGKIKGGRELRDKNKQKKRIGITMTRKTARKLSLVLLGVELVLVSVLSIMVLLVEWGIIPESVLKFQIPLNPIVTNIVVTIILITVITMMGLLYYKVLKRTYFIDIPKMLRSVFVDDNAILEVGEENGKR